MPTISMFYGILMMMMLFNDTDGHNLPHIHVDYAGASASISIVDGALLAARLPPNQLPLVQAWIEIHQEDLMADWTLAIKGQALFRIDPLRQEFTMVRLPRVVRVIATPDFNLRLEFELGEQRSFDMTPYLKDGTVFQQLKNPLVFCAAHIAYGTVVWPGEVDMAPETLFNRSVPV